MSGRFFFVVGPSGAGKDSLIEGARSILPANAFIFARRTITRPADAIGEDHEACTEPEFSARKDQGEFLITWQAHGLHYGLSSTLTSALLAGHHVIANGSRAMVAALLQKLPSLIVIEVSAPPHVLAHRLAGRGRETASDVASRLTRQVADYPATCRVLRVANDQSLETGVDRFIKAIQTSIAVD